MRTLARGFQWVQIWTLWASSHHITSEDQILVGWPLWDVTGPTVQGDEQKQPGPSLEGLPSCRGDRHRQVSKITLVIFQ